jgi:heme-degrading monooxygenase HmoA
MIARSWRGVAAPDKAVDYQRHFQRAVLPDLRQIAGFLGACLLRHEADGKVEFTAITFWESIEVIKAFADADPTVAIVAPEARAVLPSFDEQVRHDEVVFMQPAPAWQSAN